MNRQIRSREVVCINQDNENMGVIPTFDALKMADDVGLDLVQITNGKDRTPTCKILDYGKFKYDASRKQKAAAKKQRESAVKVKEIKFRPTTDINDLRTKARKALQFLNEGHRIKVTIQFKGREVSHQEVALDTLKQFVDLVPDLLLDSDPKMDRRHLVVMGGRRPGPRVAEEAS